MTGDEVEWALLDLDEHSREVFANDTEGEELQSAEEENDGDQRRIAWDRVAEQERLGDNVCGVDERGKRRG
jgi:hypothetical protein